MVFDVGFFYVVPLALGVAAGVSRFQLRGLEGILSGVSIYTAFLFGLLVHVFQLRARVTDEDTRRHSFIDLIDELEANVSYAVLVGVATTALLMTTVALTIKDTPASWGWSAPVVVLVSHMVLALLMILKRTRAVYRRLPQTY
ncbi:hypothetical protein GCM10010171_12370 [Actinokineospora fastidiosa]|uniref:Uncharacterized protein n=2 Tax=Actinokineospora fastidiosa TaxID=1816 RepID=A0A918G6J8_9PSEU|nr:hypothetical protein GCM10010171_12370 [Actinokineospora fastidiosa]